MHNEIVLSVDEAILIIETQTLMMVVCIMIGLVMIAIHNELNGILWNSILNVLTMIERNICQQMMRDENEKLFSF